MSVCLSELDSSHDIKASHFRGVWGAGIAPQVRVALCRGRLGLGLGLGLGFRLLMMMTVMMRRLITVLWRRSTPGGFGGPGQPPKLGSPFCKGRVRVRFWSRGGIRSACDDDDDDGNGNDDSVDDGHSDVEAQHPRGVWGAGRAP